MHAHVFFQFLFIETLNIDKGELFLDGTYQGYYLSYKGENITLPASTRLIAVRGGRDGILLKTSDGFYSGQPGRWLCGKVFHHGWYRLFYNTTEHSTDWQPPDIDTLRDKHVPLVFKPGYWMIAAGAESYDEVYCRGDYGKLSYYNII